jgi:hypothetical protein
MHHGVFCPAVGTDNLAAHSDAGRDEGLGTEGAGIFCHGSQWFGRWLSISILTLLRRERKRGTGTLGIIVVLDNRVLTKQYGQSFLDALPKCPVEIV